jgi:diguanylate cyclase (GGDEF)-like protein
MRIVLIEDDPGDAELVGAYLEEESDQDFTLRHVPMLADGIKVLGEAVADIVLLDLNLPDSSGLSTFTSLRARFSELPIVILSGLDDQEISTMAVREGAQDFILKSGISGRSLFRAMHHAIERHQLYLKLVGAALADELTGLSNRRGFMTLAGQLFKSAQRLGQGAFLLYVDLDGMKKVNDDLGHRQGDQMLRDTAGVLRETFRDADVLARLGGDEFAVFGLQDAQFDEADPKNRLADRVTAFNAADKRPYTLSLSIGLACLDGECVRSLDDMLVCADARMYEEKRQRSCRCGNAPPPPPVAPPVPNKPPQPGGGYRRPISLRAHGMPRIA